MTKVDAELYVSGIGATCVVTVIDAMRNDKASALMKGAGWLYTTFAPNQQMLCIAVTFLFLVAVSALLVHTYVPSNKKEAFVLGASILAIFNTGVVSPSTPAKGGSVPGAFVLGAVGIISSAIAQDASRERSGAVWVFIDGVPLNTQSETRVLIYSASSKRVILNDYVSPTFQLSLPYGDYFMELDRSGYRSIITPVRVALPASAYHVPMKPVAISSIQNILGAENIVVSQDFPLSMALLHVTDQCDATLGEGGILASAETKEAAKDSIPTEIRQRLTANPQLARVLCLGDEKPPYRGSK